MKQGNRSNIRDTGPVISNSQTSNSISNSVSSGYNETIAGNTGSPSAASTLTSAYEEVESGTFLSLYACNKTDSHSPTTILLLQFRHFEIMMSFFSFNLIPLYEKLIMFHLLSLAAYWCRG